MFEWWRQRRREKILQEPFPETWREIMRRQVGHVQYLSPDETKHLEDLVQVFLAEKHMEGCGGLKLTDEIRITVAANACILLLGLSHDMYRRVDSILVYPTTVRAPEREPGVFEVPMQAADPRHPLLGEAHTQGPVIIVWDAARRGSRHPRSGHNVVFHEFAHKLDMLDGEVDGTPPLRGTARLRRWAEVCSRVYLELRERAERGERTLIDHYGAHSEAEFFAVATETFFERGRELQQRHPELYDVLKDFYRQDPAARMTRAHRT
ncbi:MAG: zinc-dependent peptidase [Myxococcales bacterium]